MAELFLPRVPCPSLLELTKLAFPKQPVLVVVIVFSLKGAWLSAVCWEVVSNTPACRRGILNRLPMLPLQA